MIPELPVYIALLFGLTTLATLLLFIWTLRSAANNVTPRKANIIILGVLAWLLIQSALALNNVYSNNVSALPPKLLVLGILPPLLLIILLLVTKSGRLFVDSLPLKQVTYLNTVRITVEISLWLLYLNKAVPKLMTFEGGNFDILSGLTAPLVAYFGITKGVMNRKVLLAWNFICLALLINIVCRALLSTPLPIQKLAFDQPNVAILIFPYVWLPAFIVPLVLFGHLTSIRRLIRGRE